MFIRPSYYRTRMPRTPKAPPKTYAADLVWSAAAFAQRVNGSYVKYVEDPATGAETNRQLIEKCLAEPALLTDADREQGTVVHEYYKGLVFKTLKGQALNEFETSVAAIAGRDEIQAPYDIAVIASLPSCYERNVKRDEADRKVNFARGGLIGKPGDKVTEDIEVIKVIYSRNYGVYFVTGINEKDQVMFFSNKGNLNVGDKVRINGTVKAHRDSVTQLNRVKVI